MKEFTPLARLAVALCLLIATHASGLIAQDLPSNVPELLNKAFQEYEGNSRLRETEALCDRIVLVLQAATPLTDVQLQQLLTALELRGRARFLLKKEADAREDFRAILMRSPAHEFMSLTGDRAPRANPPTKAAFDAVRLETVGHVVFSITPEDADVQFRGAPLPIDRRTGGRPVLAPIGTHTVVVQRRMYEPREFAVEVTAGLPVRVDIALKRVSARIDIITSVPDVEVVIDGERRGTTAAGPLPANYASAKDVTALGPTPGFLTILEVRPGSPVIQLKKDCYLPESFPMQLDEPSDRYHLQVMQEASAPLEITGTGATVWIDGEQQKESLPFSGKLCPKAGQRERVIEVRSSRGRHIRREEPLPGKKIAFVANPRPAIAILAKNGVPPAFTEDLRETLERALQQQGASEITFFAVPASEAQRVMAAAPVSAGWLAIDPDGRRLMNPAEMMTDSTRQSASTALSKALDAQGVAEITVPAFSRDQNALVLTYLAEGSGVPESVAINLADPRSVQAAVSYFNNRFRMTKVASGLTVADVPGVAGAVVLHQAWLTTGQDRLGEGDVITSVDGVKIATGSQFDELVASRKPGETLSLQVERKKGTTGSTTLRLTTLEAKQVVALDDQTLPVNKRLLEFRAAVNDVPPQHQDIARLNLAIVLMRVGGYSAAKLELDRIAFKDLAQGEDISRGTVQYYLGVCLDGLGRTEEADRAYAAARDSPGAWLTADGLLVRPYAIQKLNDRTRRIGRF